jgi:hypothetical protein
MESGDAKKKIRHTHRATSKGRILSVARDKKKLVCKSVRRLIGNNGAAALWERMREALVKSARARQ